MNVHLIIGDAHAKPGVSNERFSMAGLLAASLASVPDTKLTIIDMGDWEDMHSLSSYDMGKKSYEGRRYIADLEAAWDARAKFNEPLDRLFKQAKANHKPRPKVRKVALGGNHFEKRINRVVEGTPMLEGVVSVSDNRCKEFGWEYIPFLTPINIDGIMYVHYWQGQGTSNPIAMGKFPSQVLMREKHVSTLVGHNHLLDLATGVNARGERILTGSVGCFLDPNQQEEYAGVQGNKQWWRGLIVLYDVVDGYPQEGWQVVPIDALQKRYKGQ